MIYSMFDKGNGFFDITYKLNKFVYTGRLNNGHITTSENDVIYRGNIHVDNEDLETAYINLIDYNSNRNPPRKIKIKDMKILSDEFIEIEKESIILSSIPIGTFVQIVEFTDINNVFDTNSVEIDLVVNSNPFFLSLPKDSNGKEYIIWVGNMCKKICI